MDPTPFSSTTTTTTAAPPISVASSADSTAGAKIRLMCSYGGYIFPRPHDKTLTYVGGDTRIFAADRTTSYSDLCSNLSKTLLGGQPFTLKYQLHNGDLDSLITVSSDEDLENMIDEIDRLKLSRIRVFLFVQSDSESLAPLVAMVRESSVKSDWFVSVLNGENSSTKVFSESSSVNCLLGLDDEFVNKVKNFGNSSGVGVGVGVGVKGLDVQSVPDSPMVETTSSFGSASSMLNLPPIKVHVEENHQKSVKKLPDEGGVMGLASPPAPEAVIPVTTVSGGPTIEYANRNDDRKLMQQQQQQQQHLQFQQPTPVVPSDLPSPDSVSSEGSAANHMSRQRHYIYQEPGVQIQPGSSRASGNSVDLKMSDSSGYVLPVQYDQRPQILQPHQYVHNGQYIHHTPSGHVPMASYYPMYPSQHQSHPQHPALDHQYPVYILPTRSTQAYNLQMQQTHYSEPPQAVSSNHPQTLPPPTSVTYSTSAATAPQLVQISSGQHQPQYVAYSQIHHSSQSATPTSATAANYAYDFADPTHAKIYYTQPFAPQLATQYQTMTSAPVTSFPETSSHIPVENLKQQPRNSQA